MVEYGCYTFDYSLSPPQNEADRSFIGGIPQIPEKTSWPTCQLCHSDQTFYFQIAFPVSHRWSGFSLAIFACTSCASDETLIPEMLRVRLFGADIPAGFLDKYQTNFRILVFETSLGRPRSNCLEKVSFVRIALCHQVDPLAPGSKVGGMPNWILDDESPGTYASEVPMFFLMQIEEEFEFRVVDSAPAQIEVGMDGKPAPAPHGKYELFLANGLYFFATQHAEMKKIYLITQID
jgi:hypothetical protein